MCGWAMRDIGACRSAGTARGRVLACQGEDAGMTGSSNRGRDMNFGHGCSRSRM